MGVIQKTFKGAALALLTAASAHGAPLPDAGLITTYDPPTRESASSAKIVLNWSTCGQTDKYSGCFAGGKLGPFVNPCSMIESGNTLVGTNVVASKLYVVDAGDGTTLVKVHQFNKRTTVVDSFASVTYTPGIVTSLPAEIKGGAVKCFVGSSSPTLFVSTSKSYVAAAVDKKTGVVVDQVGGFSPAIRVTGMTTDQRGYVNINFGVGLNTGFYTYGPNGSLVQDGGGLQLLPNSRTGVALPAVPAIGQTAVSADAQRAQRPRTVYGDPYKTFVMD